MPRTPPRSQESWRACRTRCATSRSTDRETAESRSRARFFRHSLAPWNSGSRYRRAVASSCAMTTPIGKYKLMRLIASGGMAEVYLARQAGAAGFEKLVCLKRILPHLARDKSFVDMFLNEARLAARLDHPNIVSIFDLGEANGNYFIAMEFIDGPSLRAIHKLSVERGEFLPIPEICKIVSMAAGGLQYAHDLTDPDGHPLGLVHRDISPDNILVHRTAAAK